MQHKFSSVIPTLAGTWYIEQTPTNSFFSVLYMNISNNLFFFTLNDSLGKFNSVRQHVTKVYHIFSTYESIVFKGLQKHFFKKIKFNHFSQGFEFAQWFSERIPHFWWVTWVIWSWSLIFREPLERIAHGCSFLVSNLSDWRTSLIFGEWPEDSLTSFTKKEGMSESLIFLKLT